MRIAVFSDTHLGFAYNTEIENDSFENFEEAMQKALEADLIICCGDIFDSRAPKTGVWARAHGIFTKAWEKKSGVNLVSSTKLLKTAHKTLLESTPIVAIHGNHDRRSHAEITAVEGLDNGGHLIHLHKQNIVFEKNGVKVAIHGMSSVPERFAKSTMDEWNPQPIEGAYNILILHQSIDPYIYSPLEPPSLTKENLPKGFDLILDGHLHSHFTDTVNGTPLIVVGSTVITQLERNEAEIEKGIFFIDAAQKKIDFVPLQNNRKFFYEEIHTDKNNSLRDILEKKINDIVYVRNLSKPPLVKFKINGSETDVIDQDLKSIEKKYSGKAHLIFTKELVSPEIAEKLDFMKNLREQKLSVEEIGLNLLRKNLDELQFGDVNHDSDSLFMLLSQGSVDKAFSLLTGEQKTLLEAMARQ